MPNNLTDSLARDLPDNQSAWLESLIDKGYWSPGSGFIWSSYSATVRLCEALAKKGLVFPQGDGYIVNNDHPEVIARKERQAARKKADREYLAEAHRKNAEESRLRNARAYAVQALIARHQDEYDALVAKAPDTSA